jgi:hypothetical protein
LGEQMHGAKPHPHRQLGALQDGAGDQRCLVPASPALKQLTVPDLTILCVCAPRTLEALRPAPGKPRLPARLLVWIALFERISERPFWCCTRLRGIVLILKIIMFSG